MTPGPSGGGPSTFPYGSYRRRIRLVTTGPDTVVGGLEDDFHCWTVTVRHDGVRVVDLTRAGERSPWSTCPAAGDRLAELVGLELSPSCLAVGAVADPRHQCTHQFDLAGLVIAHATRPPGVRQYDATVPFGAQSGGPVPVTLLRDGEPCLTWTLDGHACVDPPPFSDAPWRGGFLRWTTEHLDHDTAEAAAVLRRSCDIALGRGADMDRLDRASDVAVSGLCYSFQPGTAEVALRRRGTIRDFDGRTDELLADGPHAHDAWSPR